MCSWTAGLPTSVVLHQHHSRTALNLQASGLATSEDLCADVQKLLEFRATCLATVRICLHKSSARSKSCQRRGSLLEDLACHVLLHLPEFSDNPNPNSQYLS